MKKLLILIGLSLIFITNANAGYTPFLDGIHGSSAITINSYTIEDRSRTSDSWKLSFGGYTGTDFSGFYLGTIVGDNNDSETDLKNLIEYFLNSSGYEITALYKSDDGNTDFEATSTTTENWYSGTWTFTTSDPNKKVEFYSVKGGTEYALYYVNPALRNGIWTTAHLLNSGTQIPQLSHISGVITSLQGNPVPEPATMFLFGFGLIGLAWICKRKLKIN